MSANQAKAELPQHSRAFRLRRVLNWFPLGLAYAFLYWGRYNLTVAKTSLGDLMSNESFGLIFGAGTITYGLAFLINGPITDRIGGKKAMLIAVGGSTLMNFIMGAGLQKILLSGDAGSYNLVAIYSALYAGNMYFQSFGAVAIVKVNASWFHVRERGGFSGIFGVMISSGIFFAFDVSNRVVSLVQGAGPGGSNANWWIFYAPALALGSMFVIELFLLKDRPGEAGFENFDTGDASSGEDDAPIPTLQLLKRILSHPVILTVAFVEFCTGVLRNGIMHWFPIYAQASSDTGGLGLSGSHPLRMHWGLLLMIAGIIGGNIAGWVSDKVFGSRRMPAAGGLYFVLMLCTFAMVFALDHPVILGALVFLISLCVIGTHGLLSGTATMDFGGRKGAATAVGLIDGFVYFGTALQSVSLGYLTATSWRLWPPFLLPFAIVGFLLCLRIWNASPSSDRGETLPGAAVQAGGQTGVQPGA